MITMHIFKRFSKKTTKHGIESELVATMIKAAQKVAIAISNEQKEKAWVDHVRI